MKQGLIAAVLLVVVIAVGMGTYSLSEWQRNRQQQKLQNMSFLFGVFDATVDSALDDGVLNTTEYKMGQKIGTQLVQERRPVGQPITVATYLGLLENMEEKELFAMRQAYVELQ